MHPTLLFILSNHWHNTTPAGLLVFVGNVVAKIFMLTIRKFTLCLCQKNHKLNNLILDYPIDISVTGLLLYLVSCMLCFVSVLLQF